MAETTRRQQAIAASLAPPLAPVAVFFDRDGTVADRLVAAFNGTRVTWLQGARRSNPILKPPGIYLCSWIVSGSPGDTYRLRSGPQPQVTGGFHMKTLGGTTNEGTLEVVVL